MRRMRRDGGGSGAEEHQDRGGNEGNTGAGLLINMAYR